MAIRRGIVGMPGYGQCTAGAARALWRATRGSEAKIPVEIKVTYNEGSLLAHNFNGLWCQALNLKKGIGCDYFAMLHADVEPEDGWLDVLIEEMEARDLDVLGCVVPIKDPKGLTSLALEHPSKDPFRVLCRLTMREVFRLPETFTSDDIGHPLLLNTGCWVCRFGDWASKVRFTINDRIVFNSAVGIYQAQVEPEDWYFSRLCHELGLKVGATRKVKLSHAGTSRYVGYEPWGREAFDSAYLSESALPDTLPEPIKFPEEVDGWLLQSEGRALAELAKGKRVLEIGSYCGKSTICMAQTADHVHSIDPHDGRGTPKPCDTFAKVVDNIRRYGLQDKVMLQRGTLEEGVASLQEKPAFDLIFIDGAHDYEAVKSDIEHALKLLAPGGIIAFHDYREFPGQHDGRWDEGVTKAVNELLEDGGDLLSTHSTLAVVKPPQLETSYG